MGMFMKEVWQEIWDGVNKDAFIKVLAYLFLAGIVASIIFLWMS